MTDQQLATRPRSLSSRRIAALTIAVAVFAACSSSMAGAAPLKSFVVSALLKREGSDATVKLVHSRVAANNAREALEIVLQQVKTQYVGYAVIDALTSDLDEKPASCSERLQLWALNTSGSSHPEKAIDVR